MDLVYDVIALNLSVTHTQTHMHTHWNAKQHSHCQLRECDNVTHTSGLFLFFVVVFLFLQYR